MMNYKGYIGQVEYDDENRIFSGSVINTRDVITFQGESVQELENAFTSPSMTIWRGAVRTVLNRKNPTPGNSMSALIHPSISVRQLQPDSREYP